MGLGAIIGAVGSVAAAGIGAASKGGLFGGGGGGGGSAPQFKPVNLTQVQLPDFAVGLNQYTQQSQDLPGMAATAEMADSLANQSYQKALNQVYPGLTTQVSQISNLANQYLHGIIPQDVQDQVQRATAQQAIQGGYGATSGMGRNLTARDLGLTSLNLQQMGTQMFGEGASAARALNPSFTPVSSLLMTPAQLLARQDQASYYNTDIKNQQEIINTGNQMALQGYKSAQGTTNPLSGLGGGISSVTGALQKLFGGRKSATASASGGGGGGDGSGGDGFFAPASGFSGLSASDMSSVEAGGFSSGGLEAADFEALGML
jgi:hypothetical protein